ncbi:MAG: hypothetical protein WCC21_15405 [Candidatus Acidiferrales bacterium]
MRNVKVTERDGQRIIEFGEVSAEELKVFISTNGNGHSSAPAPSKYIQTEKNQPNYRAFKDSLSDKSKKFFAILHASPHGLSNDELVEKLGLKSPNQIGGITGGGIGKRANQFHVEVNRLWDVEVTRENGMRRVIYRPGPEIEKVL